MKRLTLSAKVWSLIGVTWFIGTAVATFLMYRSAQVSQEYEALFQRDVRLQDTARQMQVRFKIQVQDWKDILLRGEDPESLAKYTNAFHDEENAVRKLAEVLQRDLPDATLQALAGEFAQAHVELGRKYAAGLDAFVAAKALNPHDIDRSVKGTDRAPTELVDHLVESLTARTGQVRHAVAADSWVIAIVLAVAFGTVGVLAAFTTRGVTRLLRKTTGDLAETASQVARAASQMSIASQSLAQGSSEQAASLQQTSAATSEMTVTARQTSESSHSAATLVTQSQDRFAQAGESLRQMVGVMREIDAQQEKISKIIRIIDEIAFQTNILALNAAVESARAGESGLGFAVVADEVRNLAHRSAQAARDTAVLIEESTSKSAGGIEQVNRVASMIETITADAARIMSMVNDVNARGESQTRAIEQVALAVGQMERVTQTTAATSEENAAAAEELSAQSEVLKDLVANLRQLA